MKERELDVLASLIARALVHRATGAADAPRAPVRRAGSWLPEPIRPEPPLRGGAPPPWSGAAQELGDVAPAVGEEPPRPKKRRVSEAELANLARAAAAGRGRAPTLPPKGRHQRVRSGAAREVRIAVRIGVSNRHVHVSPHHALELFGGELTKRRDLSQPGQFAANETVAVVGPAGRIEHLRVVGPARGATQLELSLADARLLGVAPPVAASGRLENSGGDITLVGPAGSVVLDRGVIVAARHLHLSPDDARRWGLADGDFVDVRCGEGPREATFHNALVRSGPGHATELHLDVDEANAARVRTGEEAVIVVARTAARARRTLVTERDVIVLAESGAALPSNAILTPSARDRARALGLGD